MQHISVLFVIVLIFLAQSVQAYFARSHRWLRTGTSIKALEASTVQKLEEINQRYKRLSNVASEETDQQAAELQDIVEAYNGYKEIKNLIEKTKLLYENEIIEAKKEDHLQTIIELFKNKLESEELLKELLGETFEEEVKLPPIVQELEKMNQDIRELEKKVMNFDSLVYNK
jgi:hypothetical protein